MAFDHEDGKQYFSLEEERALKEFLAQEPKPKHTYTNSGGKTRKCVQVQLPSGIKTGETRYRGVDVRGRVVAMYHTPRACVEDIRDARVAYFVADSKDMKVCTGAEWIEWLGGSSTVEEPDHGPTEEEVKRSAAVVKTLSKKKRNLGDSSLAKGAKWAQSKKKK